jgi:hypothetical protein
MGRQSDSRSTDGPEYFLEEWVNGIHYGEMWHDVEEGTFKEGILSAHGIITIYQDPYEHLLYIVKVPITGYRIAPREFRPVVVDTED